jgi:two-component system copper resistance phosphate regulon response regulator CusR
MRILIIEDNVKTADYLYQGLKENYFSPEIARDGQEGLLLACQNNYSAIILDVMLPCVDGFSIIQKIRSANLEVPVIFLTAKDTIEDRVKGLELGADDYLIKPFAFSELLARIRSLLRRKQPISPDTLQVADLIIDTKKHKVMRKGTIIHLSAKEYMLLLLFVSRIGEVLPRTYIAEQVWSINFDCDTNIIDVAVKRLRDKIDVGRSKKFIHSVRGVGYVFEER